MGHILRASQINLIKGENDFEIEVESNSADNIYVQSSKR